MQGLHGQIAKLLGNVGPQEQFHVLRLLAVGDTGGQDRMDCKFQLFDVADGGQRLLEANVRFLMWLDAGQTTNAICRRFNQLD